MSDLQRAIEQNQVLLRRLAEAEQKLEQVTGLIDDVLHDPHYAGRTGRRGKSVYLHGEIQTQHLSSLRQWFVAECYGEEPVDAD